MDRQYDFRKVELVDERVAKILRTKTPAEKLAMAFECNRFGRALLKSQIQRNHPSWLEDQVLAEVARRMASGSS